MPPVHSFVIVQLPGADGGGTRTSLSAEVVRVTSDGFALEWADFSPTKVRSILRSLAGAEMAPRHMHSEAE
jgi:hypothetical protein